MRILSLCFLAASGLCLMTPQTAIALNAVASNPALIDSNAGYSNYQLVSKGRKGTHTPKAPRVRMSHGKVSTPHAPKAPKFK